MSLLFDENLSRRLIVRLADLFPGTAHVVLVGLERADDDRVWSYAASHGYAIVTKDSDFAELSLLRGIPPRVIRLRIGNCSTGEVEALIRRHAPVVAAFLIDPDVGLLELFPDH